MPIVYHTSPKSQYIGAKMDEIFTLILTSVITFLTYEAMRVLFDKIKVKKGNKRYSKAVIPYQIDLPNWFYKLIIAIGANALDIQTPLCYNY